MLSNIFYWVLNMSITATLIGLVVLILRPIKQIPRTVIYFLWVLPLIRLILPFGLGYKYSIMSLFDGMVLKTVPLTTEYILPNLTLSNSLRAADSYFPIVYKTNILEKVFSVASIVWVIITVSAILTSIALYAITKTEIREAKHLKDNIYVSNKFLSPAVFGIFKAKIIIPEYLKNESMEYILLHERTHIKRIDNLWRIVAIITCCLHWFNPFVWLFLKVFFEDMELSCDENVLRKCSEERKIDYAKALIQCESKRTVFTSAFGGAKTRVRIEKILSYKKLTVFSTVCFIILFIAIAATLLTNSLI
ncbi:UNVERIFIED_CONTAM: beta-lactamase regulating signal transducer with metallopeptidase domain [Acetivibrio alkalicellulosi]